MFRNKSAYPVYMTIGNIPKEIRRKPSCRAYVLLGYLPTTKFENVANKSSRRRMLANMYHACMGKILQPLQSAGVGGIEVISGEGNTYKGHPLFAAFVGDYPEQVLTACVKTMECPTCPAKRENLGDYCGGDQELPALRDLQKILAALDSFDEDPATFLQTCTEAGVKPVIDPFWKNLPFVNIYRSITPDVLHQLYQGILKHLVAWIIAAFGAAEIDARCRRLPPNHNIRLFMKGISSLSRVTGHEHDQIARILMGLVVDIPLPDNLSSGRLVRAVRSLLDFLYLSQYPVHTDETLVLLENALKTFHENKDIFIDLGIREQFNLPKLHFASHYLKSIKMFGTTDNFNTEYTERLHIDFAKDAYAATNHKDEFSQMTLWLERKEKILDHNQHIIWRLSGCPKPLHIEWNAPGLQLHRNHKLAVNPTVRVPISELSNLYGARYFVNAIQRFISLKNHPDIQTSAQLERALWEVRIPFQKLPVWQRLKFTCKDPVTHITSTVDSIHARPGKKDSSNRQIASRFDTALVNEGGENEGIQRKFC